MSWLEALILGLIQGLTEYLPVSSSGHLAIGSALFGIQGEENLAFTIVVHVATVCSTLVILWKEIDWIFKGLFKFQMNDETRYVINIVISMIPIAIVGVFFKDYVEAIFGSGLMIVGCMLLLTAALLSFSYYYKPRQKDKISMKDALIIGLAQACAVLPGLSRSGTTIATGLILGDNKAKLAQFSFLMVIPPILGEALLDGIKMMKGEDVVGDIPTLSLIVGFIAMEVIKSHGLSIPGDIAIIGYTDEQHANYVEPKLSAVSHQTYKMGETACQLLIDQIKGDRTIKQVIIPTHLQIRESSIKENNIKGAVST